MSCQDISALLEEIYSLAVSTGTLSAITNKIIHTVKALQTRPLASLYPHSTTRFGENGKVAGKTVIPLIQCCL